MKNKEKKSKSPFDRKATPYEIEATRKIDDVWQRARLRRRTLAGHETETLRISSHDMPIVQEAREQQRKALIAKHANAADWISKLIKKIDLAEYRELAQGEKYLTEGRRWGRTIAHSKAKLPLAEYEKRCLGEFGKNIAAKLAQKAFNLDAPFFKDFSDALQAKGVSAGNSTALAVYHFLLRNHEGVQKCRRVCEIEKLPGFPNYNKSSFCRICRELGLPVKA
jgi:hypothetical protein